VNSARDAQAAAERSLVDLQFAATQAQAGLAAAMADEGAIFKAAKIEAACEILNRRIEAARKFDEAAAAMVSALAEFDDAWTDIATVSELHNAGAGSFSTMQLREGKGRIRAAVPDVLLSLFALPGPGGASLA